MTSLLTRGLALALFTFGLLAGLQLPGFVQQYEQQVSARLSEAELSLSGFQAIADEFHGSDLAALIEHHRRSRDGSFRAEAEVIYAQWKRVALLSAEQSALRAPLPKQLWHVLWSGNREILSSTAQRHSNVVPLNTGAVVSGLIVGLLLLVIGYLGGTGLRLLLQTAKRSANKNRLPDSSTAKKAQASTPTPERNNNGGT